MVQLLHLLTAGIGPLRHCAATQHFGCFRSAANTEPDLCVHGLVCGLRGSISSPASFGLQASRASERIEQSARSSGQLRRFVTVKSRVLPFRSRNCNRMRRLIASFAPQKFDSFHRISVVAWLRRRMASSFIAGCNNRTSMRTERDSAIHLLRVLMVASLVFPAALFIYASYNDYRDAYAVADERIDRSLDVEQEQALKVFETVDRIFPEVGEVVRGMSDDQIRAAQASLTPRLQRIVGVMRQVQSIVLIGRDGRPLASSTAAAMAGGADFSDRAYFKAQAGNAAAGTYVGDVRRSTIQAAATDLFDLSRRLQSADGSFQGVIAVAVRPRYFDDFYAMIEQAPGNFYALVRADGAVLARYPASPEPARQLSLNGMLRLAIGRGLSHGLYSTASKVDGRDRRVGFRKLPGYPVYAIAGIDGAAIRAAWLDRVGGHLIFGLPVTLLLFSALWVVLRRTKRLYDEARRREFAEDALRQAQRLEAIGQLTGGVAHDFNNLLMIVSGTAARLRRHVSGEKETQLLDAIANATARGESLTRQLLAFSRRQTHQPAVIDLAARLPEIKDMLSRSLRGDIDIRLGVPRRPCAVKVDPSEFELALLNLAFNARDAMPTGGTLTISAKPVLMRGKEAEEGLSGDYVAIRVADTGT